LGKGRIHLMAAMLAALAGCSGGDARERGREPPLVKAETATAARFVETLDAVGNALANEQVTLTAPVTDRLLQLNFDDGAFVQSGQIVAELAQGQESAQLAEAQARVREAGQQLERVRMLRDRGFATKSDFDVRTAAAATARAQAAEARASIGDRVIRAPFAGWVSLRTISVGAMVTAGTEIATISDTSSIKLDFPVPETMLAAIRPGLPIDARAAAYPDQPVRGRIATVDSVVDPDSRAVTVRAILPNGEGRLKPGMLLSVKIETRPRTGLSVPELAVVGEAATSFVYVVGPDLVVKRTNVRTGLRSAGRIEILSGLRPGDRVVTEGVVKLTDRMRVRLAAPDRSGPAAAGGAPARTR
jgi:membrane fusion protein (multidrug efflux system)